MSHPEPTAPAAALDPKRLRGVLLDVDGTLIDSNDAHARAWVEALREAGFERTFEEVRPLIGMGGDQLIPRLTGLDSQSEEGQRLTQGWLRHFKPLIPTLHATRGARALVQGLHARGLQVLLATSGEAEIVDELLKQAHLDDLQLERVSSSEVESSKPAPDLVQAGLEKLGLPAGEALLVGDTPYDAQAAHKAGVPCVLLRCGGNTGLEEHAPTLDDPQALLEVLEGTKG
ncbi:HAD-superfamily hydrolase subfamily IA, variant 3 [Deinococcus geothermalis DSM 11300]|uniref:HAD-superfamily hydrolase subfamily IA, variant 3 n=1 Tax=Deinococcus geothermalis (strain DSM 11300 / CIP 105573 / AG-3a) TaxID=319795 RepID=Q1J0J3_DEIGD|nr:MULTISPECIES: HAD family hydrolase [Deinococcus]ABF44991.1 HAD-superfamily hydrolase subfamily IA, variant 3 [Deinococcus geothermalis DSM 11300]MBI0446942.1 HAD family hydrolase [Deinococcus sp. DB0503]TDE87490.1 HAD family hydrolase [Deinococcus sp. S9]